MRIRALIAIALLAALPAWAITKCVGADGRVSFQDAPCADGRGEEVKLRLSSAAAPKPATALPTAVDTAPLPAGAGVAAPPIAVRKENTFGERWQRRTFLENRGLPDARAALENHQSDCARAQARLAAKKRRALNNLAGATWEESISGEMQAAAISCDTQTRVLQSELDMLQREYRELQK